MAANNVEYETEIPSCLKQLARMISRGFFQIEDSLIVDMLVRNPCMKEKDLEDLLKFDLKLLRSRMATLKNEKMVQVRLRMETGFDGKAQKVNYYFINYKSLVNVIKYKLDHMRKRMETQERDATNRASFRCTNGNCTKTFTDLEAGELFDMNTGTFICTFCRHQVEEDESAGPKQDSRLLLAKFNEQLHPVFELLRKAENIKLAPELLEPEPPRLEDAGDGGNNNRGGTWSGEATRRSGLNDTTRIDIKIGDNIEKAKEEKKERPVWLTESTITENSSPIIANNLSNLELTSSTVDKNLNREDIMAVLLSYEKKPGSSGGQKPVMKRDSESEEEIDPDKINFDFGSGSTNEGSSNFNPSQNSIDGQEEVAIMDSDDDEQVPLVQIGFEKIPITEVKDDLIERMNASEKEAYIQIYQNYYSHLFD